jgi:hypothetical protein
MDLSDPGSHDRAMSFPPRRRLLWLLAVVILGTIAVGVGIGVQADLDAVPAITPYDPLPRW